MQYEIDITRKTTYRIRVEAMNKTEAVNVALDAYKKGNEGIIQSDTIDIKRNEQVIT